MAQNDRRYIGLFIRDKKSLWNTLKQLVTTDNTIRWIYITDEHPPNQLGALLKRNTISLKKGQIIPSSEFNLREQVVRARPVIEVLEEKVGSTSTEQIIFVEMTWAVRTPSGDIYLRELQGELQQFLARYPKLTLICIYNESILLDDQLLLGLMSHPAIYSSGEVKDNPYFLPAQIHLYNRLRERFEYWMGNIDETRKELKSTKKTLPMHRSKRYALEKSIHTRTAKSDEGRWKIRCFGELRIHRENGDLVDWNTKAGATKKLKAIFAYLLLRGEKGATGEQLADLLWPEAETTQSAMNRLYHSIRYLRQVLEGKKGSGKDESFVVNQSSMYYLQLPYDSWIDLPMFRELCTKGKIHTQNNELEQAKICFQSAERLYSGLLFQDIPLKYIENNEDDWCWSKRYWYKDMYLKLLYSLASVHRQMGDISLAISYADRALGEDPNLEEAHKEKMLALTSAKRYDALERQFKVYSESLKKFNMGAPSPTLKKLYEELLQKVLN